MSRLRWIGLLLVLFGAAVIVYGILAGEIQVGLLLFVIPYLYGATALGAVAILAVVTGVFVLFVDAARRAPPMEEPAAAGSAADRPREGTEWGGVVVIGPIPIVFGSAPRSAAIALAIAGAILTAILVLFLLVR